MNPNPIKALSDLFGKLVIEHGSAVIQEKHIALLKEQFSLLEKENANLKAQNQALETEKQNFKIENINLKKKIQLYEKSSHVTTLDEIESKILLFLANQDKFDISPEDIAHELNRNIQLITFHLENLRTKKMVDARPIAPFDHSPKRFWSIAQSGRRYLIENKYIS